MFYTKYRPQKFSEISKPNDTASALMTQISTGKTSHAYLFVGSRGTGKTTTARILAKALNCLNLNKKGLEKGDPCSECEHCLKIQASTFLDLIEIDAASNRGIDDIRELKDKIKLSPSLGKTKTYIIDEVHMLTSEAFNALLKTLEEPPKHAVFILCTTEFHKVPDTIKSRCQVYKFKRATTKQLVERLDNITKAEGAKVKKEDLEKIALASLGGFRDAETMLQQVIEGNLDAASFVGLSSQEIYIDFVQNIIEKDLNSALSKVNRLLEEGLDLNVWVLDLLNYLRDLLFVSVGVSNGLLDTIEDNSKKIKKQAAAINSTQIVEIIEVFIKAAGDLNSSPIVQLPVELALVKLLRDEDAPKSPPKNNIPNNDDDIDLLELERQGKQDKKDADAQEKTVKKATTSISIEDIKKGWKNVLQTVVASNNSIHALLKAATPTSIEDRTLVLEVSYAFHKERLEAPKTRRIVENFIYEEYAVELTLCCKVLENKPELTDRNVLPAYSANINEIFDGGLPL